MTTARPYAAVWPPPADGPTLAELEAAAGGRAAALAALLQERDAMRGRRVGIVLSGANVDSRELARVLAEA